jgi:hypothetical protein
MFDQKTEKEIGRWHLKKKSCEDVGWVLVLVTALVG